MPNESSMWEPQRVNGAPWWIQLNIRCGLDLPTYSEFCSFMKILQNSFILNDRL